MPRSAFSLVELSIVLVILGLLVGGVLGGQSLIKAAQLRSVVTDRDKHITAINVFREKYHALPGDMANASDYWGTASGGCPGGAGSGTQTCNGNGNGRINYDGELLRAWQHLSNDGLIEGRFSGLTGPNGNPEIVIGENAPKSKISGAGFSLAWSADIPSEQVGMQKGHFLVFGGNGSSVNDSAALVPEDSYNIDRKVDDGNARSGAIGTTLSVMGFATCDMFGNCTTPPNPCYSPFSGEYNVMENENLCVMLFDTGS